MYRIKYKAEGRCCITSISPKSLCQCPCFQLQPTVPPKLSKYFISLAQPLPPRAYEYVCVCNGKQWMILISPMLMYIIILRLKASQRAWQSSGSQSACRGPHIGSDWTNMMFCIQWIAVPQFRKRNKNIQLFLWTLRRSRTLLTYCSCVTSALWV